MSHVSLRIARSQNSWSAAAAAAPAAARCRTRTSTSPAPLAGPSAGRRDLHASAISHAVSNLTMPAMSPTMTEGGVASWKVKEGQAFAAGDVLLEIETDKATMDVEAQDDGILGKIVVQDGAKDVKVGRVIALLAEEGDDISNLEAPKEDSAASESVSSPPSSSSSSTSSSEKPPTTEGKTSPSSSSSSSSSPSASSTHSPSSSKPSGWHAQFPSVSRLLSEHSVSQADADRIHGTGVRGMLTKGDVLAHLGIAKSPTGSFTVHHAGIAELGGRGGGSQSKGQKEGALKGGAEKSKEPQGPLEASAIRSLILSGLSSSSSSARARAAPLSSAASSANAFDALLDDYAPPPAAPRVSKKFGAARDVFAGLI